VKKFLLINFCFLLSVAQAQSRCEKLAPVPEKFDFAKMTDSTRFMPLFTGGLPDSYYFEIRNNWGEIIFKTDIPEQGWNGRYLNRNQPTLEGTYMWIMSCSWTSDSTALNCSGYVSCINTGASGKIIPLDTIQCRPVIFVPDAFTPNGDSNNDTFTPQFGCVPSEFEMRIYDRWGNPVFITTDPSKGWDGRINGAQNAPIEVYVWKVKCKFYAGDKWRQFTGHVSMIR
jgi:gliding motility-associated-like protein